MAFGEMIENKIDYKQEETDALLRKDKSEMASLKVDIARQPKGESEKLPQNQIDNITRFYETFGNDTDSFEIRAKADGYQFSDEGARAKIEQARILLGNLQKKGITLSPNLSTGNDAQAWVRAMTLLDQLPQHVLIGIKDSLSFKVETTNEKDEKGTNRFAALDIKMGNTIIPNLQDGNTPTLSDLNEPDLSNDEVMPNPASFNEELDLPSDELNKFSSWEALKKPLAIPVLFKMKLPTKQGKEERRYFFKQTYYALENGKIKVANKPWRGTNEKNFKFTLKNSSRAINITDTLQNIHKDNLTVISKENKSLNALKKRFDYLNTLAESNPRFALNQFYENYHQKKQGEKYLTKAKEIEVQSNERLLANN